MIDRVVAAVEVVVRAVGVACGVAGEEPAEDGVTVAAAFASKNLRHHCRLSKTTGESTERQAIHPLIRIADINNITDYVLDDRADRHSK